MRLLILITILCVAKFSAAQPAWMRVDAIQSVLNGAEPRMSGLRMDLPGVTQDGSSVQLGVEFAAPISDADPIEALYLFALGNPSLELAEFQLSSLIAPAGLVTRIRLDGSQTVVALARTVAGHWFAESRDVRVTVSGCLSRDGTYRAEDVMQARVRVGQPRVRAGQSIDVRTMINHPMETGLRNDAVGHVIPENIIRSFVAEHGDTQVLRATLHRAMAANPYVLFHYRPSQSGTLTLTWEEDTGRSASTTADVMVN